MYINGFASQYILFSCYPEEIELILKEETIDVYNYISKKDPLPDHLKSLEVMKQLQDYALKRTMATPEGYKITNQLGLVQGITVRSRSAIGNIAGGFMTLFGGRLKIMAHHCRHSRLETGK
jgi:hypothetical protein